MTHLDTRIVATRGTFTVDIAFTAEAGEVVALLGPNGAGKTTALRALAGLLPLGEGRISIAGTTVDEPSTRTWTPPERRRVGVVFQDYLLFPHLSARENVAFGPRSRGASRSAAREQADRWLDRVGLASYSQHRPRQLSGGQAQRVALARALATEPDLLLLDEPLAALDARTRLETRSRLHKDLVGYAGTTLLVTHDPIDALVLADRLIVIEEGRIVQSGDAEAITARPRTDYVARLVGLNLYRGMSSGLSVAVDGFEFAVAEPVSGEAFVAFPPSAVAIFVTRPDGSPRNTWPATVSGIQRHGDNLRVQLDGPVKAAADITPAAAAALRLEAGQAVWAAVKATETRTYPT
ncbi:ABC transporter ATP-binding protein [Hamadaea tsunoensis]|uniref:ABC transporter ATP-binding protein n=1 Tax=Hamadaea tsunoensis TaxID=53368 RepID=UPI00041D152F|nr:ABC transporter ATP-binding protein [Hamadaea tsunoensis]